MTESVTGGDRSGLAAEYALGTLDPAERARAEALIRFDRAFELEVREWQRRLDPLFEASPPVSPPPGALDAILHAIEETQQPAPGRQSAQVLALRRQVRALRWTAGAASGLAAALVAVFAIWGLRIPETGQRFVAILESPDRTAAFVAAFQPDTGALAIRRLGPPSRPGRSYELWAIRDAAPPQSFGVVDQTALISPARLKAGTGDAPLAKILLAITDEPEGGSKDGKPSGAPVFAGKPVQAPL